MDGASVSNSTTLFPDGVGNDSVTEQSWMNGELVAANIAVDVLILLVSVFGNILVIFTILREKKLQTTCNFLLVHLAICDISLVTTSIPFEIYSLVHGSRWDFGLIFCKILWPLNTLFYITSALMLTVISIDRYRVFVQTFKPKLRRAQLRRAIALVYVFAILCVVPYFLVLKMEDDSCFEVWPKFLYRQLYTVFLFSVQYALPLLIMFFVYARIGVHLTQKTQRVQLSRKGPRTRVSLYSMSGSITENRQNKARKRRSQKALKMILTVVVVFAVFMLPFQLLWMVADLGSGIEPDKLSKLGKLFVIFSYIGSCTLNPFIYGVADKRFRQGYRSLLNYALRMVTRQSHPPSRDTNTGHRMMITSSSGTHKFTDQFSEIQL